MDPRQELEMLRRLAELEAKAGRPVQTEQPQAKPEPSFLRQAAGVAGNLAAGALRGAGSIGATLLAPQDMLQDALQGRGLSLQSNRERRAAMDAGLRSMGADPDDCFAWDRAKETKQ